MIRFPDIKALNDAARKLPVLKWSRTYKSWYMSLNEENYKRIWKALHWLGNIETKNLREYLTKRLAVKATEVPEYIPEPKSEITKNNVVPVIEPLPPQPSVAYRLSYENLLSLQQTVNYLILKSYSRSTIKTYRSELMVFFQVLGKNVATSLTTDDVKRWLLQCISNGLMENTMHSRINALKFFYEQVLGRDKFFLEIPRSKKAQQLPNILGEREITRLFNALTNKKR